jgi:hypothetical protein
MCAVLGCDDGCAIRPRQNDELRKSFIKLAIRDSRPAQTPKASKHLL